MLGKLNLRGCITPTLCVSAVLLAGCASPQDMVLPGATAEQMQRDRSGCDAEAKTAAFQSGAPRVSAADPLADTFTYLIFRSSDIADCLKKRGYVPVTVSGAPPLFDAISRGDAIAVRTLVDKGADVNAQMSVLAGSKNEGGVTMLMAASVDHVDVVHALLDKGADVNARASDGTTALMLAAASDNREVVQALLARGADVNARRNDGATALTRAKDPEVKTLLVQAGAKP